MPPIESILTSQADSRPRVSPKWLMAFFGGGVFFVVSVVTADYWSALPADATATYVGRNRCVACHQAETDRFSGSHHDKAMDLATEETVLGDFDNATLQHDGITSRMFRQDGKFMVNTDGPDGSLHDFEVKYVFGVDPLQQYMVEFDRPGDATDQEIGRLQVLRISWDVINNRWFYLRPPDVDQRLLPDDPLHWTGTAQRWQTMCAECHSTDLQKNFDPVSNRYHTTFSEIDVSCEACHGPGSLHVELANQTSLFWDRNHGYGLASLKGQDPEPQLQACAPCHSRRGELTDSFVPGMQYCNHFQLETMRPDTYHADGQIKDEVYVYGSFIQSRMYHQGIRCTDCHDPHSLKLKHEGNQTCTSCHQHSAGKYDVPSHHHHAVGSAGAQCVNCHMPHTTYMQIDKRRDHSLRVPRPDLSVKQATPNACSACHINDQLAKLDDPTRQLVDGKEYADWLRWRDEGNEPIAQALLDTDRWCDEACEKWYGADRKQPDHFSEAITAFRRGDQGAPREMLELALSNPVDKASLPDLARASIMAELAEPAVMAELAGGRSRLNQLPERLDELAVDPQADPIVRSEAGRLMIAAGPRRAEKTLMRMIEDDVRLVRVVAARQIIDSGLYERLSGQKRLQVDQVLDREVRSAMMVNSDQAAAHIAWGVIEERRGHDAEAAEAYQTAIRIEPETVGARSNLALLLERMAGDVPAEQASAMLKQVRQLRSQELTLMRRDANLLPENAEIQYRYGLMLYLNGKLKAARDAIRRAHELEPEHPTIKQALDLIEEKVAQPE